MDVRSRNWINVRAMSKLLTSTALIGLLFAVRLDAHDFWLTATREATGFKISGLVGEKFPVPDSRTAVDRVESWRVVGPSGDLGLPRNLFQDGEYLATRVALPAPGLYLGMMTIFERDIEMKGAEFTEYLRDEGLDQVIAERARLGQTDATARERYARYSKIVLSTGPGSSAHLTRAAGMKAEFVPSVNPAAVKPGDSIAVQLLIEGKPVCSCLIPFAQVENAHVVTIEGLGDDHPLQHLFMSEVGAQCGICTPGMIMAAMSLGADPTRTQMREALAGNLCRCTGYEAIYRAIGAEKRANRRTPLGVESVG